MIENQIENYKERAKYRVENVIPAMAVYAAFRKDVYKDGALTYKAKRLISLAMALQSGSHRSIQFTTKDAIESGATKAEILEVVAVAIAYCGTSVSAESWRVIRVLEELGQL